LTHPEFRSLNLICEKDPIRKNYTSELQLGKIVSKTGSRFVIVFGKGTASSRATKSDKNAGFSLWGFAPVRRRRFM